VNACGVDDFHDGVNYMRTACVIAVSRARDMFEPFVHQVRCFRIMEPRQCSISCVLRGMQMTDP
jgi:hypothetical protein